MTKVNENQNGDSWLIAKKLDLKDSRNDCIIEKNIWDQFASENGGDSISKDTISVYDAMDIIDSMSEKKSSEKNKNTDNVKKEMLDGFKKSLPDVILLSAEEGDSLGNFAKISGYSSKKIKNMKFLYDRSICSEFRDENGNLKKKLEHGTTIVKIGKDTFQYCVNDDGTRVMYKVDELNFGPLKQKGYYRKELSEENKTRLENFNNERAIKNKNAEEERKRQEIQEAKDTLTRAAENLNTEDNEKKRESLKMIQESIEKLNPPEAKLLSKEERKNVPSFNEYKELGKLEELENGTLVKIFQKGDPNNPNDGGKIIYGAFIKDPANGNYYLMRKTRNETNNVEGYNIYALQGDNSYLEYSNKQQRIGQIGKENGENYIII